MAIFYMYFFLRTFLLIQNDESKEEGHKIKHSKEKTKTTENGKGLVESEETVKDKTQTEFLGKIPE